MTESFNLHCRQDAQSLNREERESDTMAFKPILYFVVGLAFIWSWLVLHMGGHFIATLKLHFRCRLCCRYCSPHCDGMDCEAITNNHSIDRCDAK